MVRINTLNAVSSSTELEIFLLNKFRGIIDEYNLSDITNVFAIIILDENEADYLSDKLFEFSEILTFDEVKYIHTVWVADDNYSEDIYIPYTVESMTIIEKRCT